MCRTAHRGCSPGGPGGGIRPTRGSALGAGRRPLRSPQTQPIVITHIELSSCLKISGNQTRLSSQRDCTVKNLLIITCLISASHCHALEAKDIDILGFKSGMSQSEIEANIKSKFPNAVLQSSAKFKSEFGMPESIGKVSYCYGEPAKEGGKELHGGVPVYKGCHTKLIEFSFTRISGRLFKISRKDTYGSEKVSWDAANQAVKQKYGEPTDKAGAGYSWHPLQAGSPQLAKCSLQNYENKPDYRAYLPNCGYSLTFNSNKSLNNPGLATDLSMTFIDYAIVNEDFTKSENLAKGQQQQRQSNEIRGAATPKM